MENTNRQLATQRDSILASTEVDPRVMMVAKAIQIMQGKNALADLHAEKEAYLELREKEAVERVAETLKASESALNTALSHYKELSQVRSGISNVVQELSKYQKDLEDKRKAFDRHVGEMEMTLAARLSDVKKAEERARAEMTQIISEWGQIHSSKRSLDEQEAQIKDQRLRLEGALKELKKK
jgi:chromosome segregation ATPase